MNEVPHEPDEWRRITIHLRMLDRLAERYALVAADGDARETVAEPYVIHE